MTHDTQIESSVLGGIFWLVLGFFVNFQLLASDKQQLTMNSKEKSKEYVCVKRETCG